MYVFEQNEVEFNTLERSDKGGGTAGWRAGQRGLPGPWDLEGMEKVYVTSGDHCSKEGRLGKAEHELEPQDPR